MYTGATEFKSSSFPSNISLINSNMRSHPHNHQDETMRSGEDVKAFTAVVNRDIEGAESPISQPPFSSDVGGSLSQGTNYTPSQLFQQWKSSKFKEEAKGHIQEQKSSAVVEVNRQRSVSESQHAVNDTSRDISQPSRPQDDLSMQQADQHNIYTSQAMNMQNTDKNLTPNIAQNPKKQLQRMQRMDNHQAITTEQTANATNLTYTRQVPFAQVLPIIKPQLDKDRAMLLQGLYDRLMANRINKFEFIREMGNLVGAHMVKVALYKAQQKQMTENASNQFYHPSKLSAEHYTQKPSPHVSSSPIHQSSDSNSLPMDNNAQNPRVIEHQSDSHGVQGSHMSTSNVNGITQQHIHFPQSPFPTYGNAGASANTNTSLQSIRQKSQDLEMRQPSTHKDQSLVLSGAFENPDSVDDMNVQHHKSQVSTPHGPSSTSPGQLDQESGVPVSSKDDTFEMMASRPGFSMPMNKPVPMSITAQLECQNMAVENFSLVSASNGRTHPKRTSVGQKKTFEAPVNSSSKKQKVSGASSDQSIQQLNDVTAVSGVNIREEEEQLFSVSKEETRVSEAFRKIVQEEEERLFLQKIPLQKKLAEIMEKCGVKHRSNGLEHCLSLCVEERLRGFISNLVRHSRQRVDFEKRRHQTVVTSDVRQQIMSMNQKAREEWEKKQADAEQLQRTDEPEGSGDGDDSCEKSFKVNREGDDKMRTSAANVAARAAVGGDDIFSKWQLMAELARQKRDGGADSASTSQPSIDVGPKPMSTSERKPKDNPDTERISGAVSAIPGLVKKSSKNQDLGQSGSLASRISVKDVLSVLGRENHLSRSTLTYRLYEKVHSDF